MLLLMLLLTLRMGIRGITITRLGHAIISLLLYIPLLRHLPAKPPADETLASLKDFVDTVEVTS